ncbi:MAG: hypothetical protein ACI4ET_09820 [Bilifractor sp.]
MDREEYHQKLDELTSYVREKDYDNALSIVEEVDWRRVKSINTLNMVADVYEVNKDYESAKDILILAYNRASIGRNILYRLVEVCIKLNQINEAEKYFKEFSKVARNDNSRCILQYKLYKAKGAPLEAQIDVLEEYKEREYTERWSYELALLYAKAGDVKKCVETCDDLILWFSEGRYVLKAMELKKKYEPLTPSQEQSFNRMKVAENRRRENQKAKGASEDLENTESDASARAGMFTEENRRPSNAQAVYVRPVKKVQTEEQSSAPIQGQGTMSGQVEQNASDRENASASLTSANQHKESSSQTDKSADAEDLSPAAAAAAKARKDGTVKKMNTADFNLDAFLAETAGAFSSEVHKEQEKEKKPLAEKDSAELPESLNRDQKSQGTDSDSQSAEAGSRQAGTGDQKSEPEEVEEEVIDDDAADENVAETEVAVETPDGNKLETEVVEESPEEKETPAREDIEAEIVEEVSDGIDAEPEIVEETADETDAESEIVEEAAEETDAGPDSADETADAEPEIIEEAADETDAEPEIVEEAADETDAEPEIVEEAAEIVEEESESSTKEPSASGKTAGASDTASGADARAVDENPGIRLRDLKEEDLSTEVTPQAQRAEAETNAAVHADSEEQSDSMPQSAVSGNAGQPKKKEIHYIEELEVPDPKPTEAERNSHTHTIPLDTIGANTIPISIDKILSEETPEERRIRIMNRAKPTRMNEEQRKIFTYFARIPGMDAQILEAISCVYEHAGEKTSLHGNIAVMGARGTGKTRLTHGLVVAMCKDLGIEAAKVARVKGADLNAKDPAKVVARMAGGFFVIEEVSGMNEETVGKLSQAMEFRTDCMITIIEDEKVAMRAFLKKYPRFAAKFDRVISIPVFTNDELITFARTYATENGFKIDDMAILALYTMIGNMQTEEEPVTISVVKEMIDRAINRSSAKRRRGKKSRKDKWLVLQEKDFDLT